MTSLGIYDYGANSITECVRSPVKNHSPSGSFFRSFIRSRFFIVSHQHNILIWEFKIHGLVVIHGLMRQMISQYTPIYCFLGCIFDVVLG